VKIQQGQKVLVVGAGPAGCVLAAMLARRGFAVTVLEKRPDMRQHAIPGGRSINLALAERGIRALDGIGVMQRIRQFALPMRGRMLHEAENRTLLLPYGKNDREVIYSVHRGLLNQVLLDQVEVAGAKLYFDSDVVQMDVSRPRLTLADGTTLELADTVLFGADGAGSILRRTLVDAGAVRDHTDWLDHGYRELTIPPDATGGFALDSAALHIWPRGDYMLIALPNTDHSFTSTLFLPLHGETNSFDALAEHGTFCHWFTRHFPDAAQQIRDLPSQARDNPVGQLGTVHCTPWNYRHVLLVGDAAHAIVPFHGQGMNCALEDCSVLDQLLDGEYERWPALFAAFHAQRLADTEAIARMALENYTEMRDRVTDAGFRMRNAIEHQLERRHASRFVPRYSMVMFHTLPYHEAYRRGAIQADILGQLSAGVDSIDSVDWSLAEHLVQQNLDLFKN